MAGISNSEPGSEAWLVEASKAVWAALVSELGVGWYECEGLRCFWFGCWGDFDGHAMAGTMLRCLSIAERRVLSRPDPRPCLACAIYYFLV